MTSFEPTDLSLHVYTHTVHPLWPRAYSLCNKTHGLLHKAILELHNMAFYPFNPYLCDGLMRQSGILFKEEWGFKLSPETE